MAYLDEVLRSSQWSGGGAFSQRCEAQIREAIGGRSFALLTPSGTAALEMASLVLDLAPGDEVVMPSFTFSSCANAVVLRGAIPVFVDVRGDTLNIDPDQIEAAISSRTKAIMQVHYGGVCCDADSIGAIAAGRSLAVIEDAAQAFLSTYKGRSAGTLGSVAAFSFHDTKNVGCGEGGAFTTSSGQLGKAAEIIRDKGTNRSQFLRGEVDKYSWVDKGSSYLASEFQAAVLLAQLERARAITDHRLGLWNAYHAGLNDLERAGRIRRPTVPQQCGHNGHIYRIMLADEPRRNTVMRGLQAAGVGATFHFVPLHTSTAGRRWGRSVGSMRETIEASNRLLRLPLHAGMAESDVESVVERTIGAVEAAYA